MLYEEIKQCRICGNKNLVSILDLGEQALTGVFPKKSETVETGPLEIVKCFSAVPGQTCGLVQLKHNYQMSKLYGDNYGYRSGLNQVMVKHLQAIVKKIETNYPLKDNDLIIDIASNDGTLLASYQNHQLDLLGIDPTVAKFKEFYPNHINTIADFFLEKTVREKCGAKKAKVITSIAMFYDLPEPLEIMKQIEKTLADDGIWVTEQSYLPEMIKNVSYDTICHEHLEFYALRQFQWLAVRANLKIIALEFNRINGASLALTLAKQNSPYPEAKEAVEKILNQEAAAGFDDLEIYRDFQEKTSQHREDLKALLAELKQAGKKVFGYGASTKGNVILQYCGISRADLPFIADVNEYKFDRYTPGTEIPIVSESEAKKLNPDYFLVLPWHFRDTIFERESAYLKAGGHLIFPLPKIEII